MRRTMEIVDERVSVVWLQHAARLARAVRS